MAILSPRQRLDANSKGRENRVIPDVKVTTGTFFITIEFSALRKEP